MAGSSSRSGYRSNAYFGRETNYGTAVAAGTGVPTGVLRHLIENGLDTDNPKEPNDALFGSRSRRPLIATFPRFKGPLSFYLSYGGISPLLAAAIGRSVVVDAVGPAYQYRYDVGDDLIKYGSDALAHSFTFIQRMLAGTNEIREYAGVKVGGFTLTLEAGKKAMIEFPSVASARDDASAVNTDAVLDGLAAADLTYAAPPVVFRPADTVCRIGDMANPLVAGDNVQATKIVFKNNNNMAEDDWGSEGLAEPEPDGFSDYDLEITLARLAVTTYRTWVDSHTELQGFLQLVDPSAANNSLEFRYGAMHLLPGFEELPKGPEMIRPTLKFKLHRAESTNPTWTGLVHPFEVAEYSTRITTNPFGFV